MEFAMEIFLFLLPSLFHYQLQCCLSLISLLLHKLFISIRMLLNLQDIDRCSLIPYLCQNIQPFAILLDDKVFMEHLFVLFVKWFLFFILLQKNLKLLLFLFFLSLINFLSLLFLLDFLDQRMMFLSLNFFLHLFFLLKASNFQHLSLYSFLFSFFAICWLQTPDIFYKLACLLGFLAVYCKLQWTEAWSLSKLIKIKY